MSEIFDFIVEGSSRDLCKTKEVPNGILNEEIEVNGQALDSKVYNLHSQPLQVSSENFNKAKEQVNNLIYGDSPINLLCQKCNMNFNGMGYSGLLLKD